MKTFCVNTAVYTRGYKKVTLFRRIYCSVCMPHAISPAIYNSFAPFFEPRRAKLGKTYRWAARNSSRLANEVVPPRTCLSRTGRKSALMIRVAAPLKFLRPVGKKHIPRSILVVSSSYCLQNNKCCFDRPPF